jgi:hypothetical protein
MAPTAAFANPMVPYLVFPTPLAAWYCSPQPMPANGAAVQPIMLFSIPPSVTSQTCQCTNTGPVISITNHIVNEIGNDNSTNLQILKNGTLSLSHRPKTTHSQTFAKNIGHQNKISGKKPSESSWRRFLPFY